MQLSKAWLYGILSAAILGCGSLAVTIATTWVNGVNADRKAANEALKDFNDTATERKADHETLRELFFKDRYLNGEIRAAPVTNPDKK